MKRTPTLIAAALLGVLLSASIATARSTAPAAHASRTAVIQLRSTHLGRILVNGSGHIIYMFTHDHGAQNSCVRISECSETWPSLTTTGTPKAGAGVRQSLLSTITLRGGRKQVTYAGHPLYLYSVDAGTGDTSYVGERVFGGSWLALNASGHAIR